MGVTMSSMFESRMQGLLTVCSEKHFHYLEYRYALEKLKYVAMMFASEGEFSWDGGNNKMTFEPNKEKSDSEWEETLAVFGEPYYSNFSILQRMSIRQSIADKLETLHREIYAQGALQAPVYTTARIVTDIACVSAWKAFSATIVKHVDKVPKAPSKHENVVSYMTIKIAKKMMRGCVEYDTRAIGIYEDPESDSEEEDDEDFTSPGPSRRQQFEALQRTRAKKQDLARRRKEQAAAVVVGRRRRAQLENGDRGHDDNKLDKKVDDAVTSGGGGGDGGVDSSVHPMSNLVNRGGVSDFILPYAYATQLQQHTSKNANSKHDDNSESESGGEEKDDGKSNGAVAAFKKYNPASRLASRIKQL